MIDIGTIYGFDSFLQLWGFAFGSEVELRPRFRTAVL